MVTDLVMKKGIPMYMLEMTFNMIKMQILFTRRWATNINLFSKDHFQIGAKTISYGQE